jgi:DNA-directed RNA polymerase specialized sigma24 family protein
MTPGDPLESALVLYRPRLSAFVRKHAGPVLRYEGVDDVVQGVLARALSRRHTYVHTDEERSLGWLLTVARSFIADRRVHWSALKRQSGRLLRITANPDATSDALAVALPALEATGPATFAERREQLLLAVQALSTLLPRDRRLVTWFADGLAIGEQADRLHVSYAAAQRAHVRALARFRKAFELLRRRNA